MVVSIFFVFGATGDAAAAAGIDRAGMVGVGEGVGVRGAADDASGLSCVGAAAAADGFDGERAEP